jgi:hypothetical protein
MTSPSALVTSLPVSSNTTPFPAEVKRKASPSVVVLSTDPSDEINFNICALHLHRESRALGAVRDGKDASAAGGNCLLIQRAVTIVEVRHLVAAELVNTDREVARCLIDVAALQVFRPQVNRVGCCLRRREREGKNNRSSASRIPDDALHTETHARALLPRASPIYSLGRTRVKVRPNSVNPPGLVNRREGCSPAQPESAEMSQG